MKESVGGGGRRWGIFWAIGLQSEFNIFSGFHRICLLLLTWLPLNRAIYCNSSRGIFRNELHSRSHRATAPIVGSPKSIKLEFVVLLQFNSQSENIYYCQEEEDYKAAWFYCVVTVTWPMPSKRIDVNWMHLQNDTDAMLNFRTMMDCWIDGRWTLISCSMVECKSISHSSVGERQDGIWDGNIE